MLDLKGLKCPLPALHTRRALRHMPSGARLTVTCTDPMALIDIPNVAREAGASVEARAVSDPVITFVLQKG